MNENINDDVLRNAATNETLIGDLRSYFTTTDHREPISLSTTIDPSQAFASTVNVGPGFYDKFDKPGTLTVGALVLLAAQQSYRTTVLNSRLSSLQTACLDNLRRLSTLLNEFAEENGLSESMRDLFDEYNGRTSDSFLTLTPPVREYTVRYTMTREIYVEAEVTVEASDPDEAVRMVEDDPESYFDMDDALNDAIYNGSYNDSGENAEIVD